MPILACAHAKRTDATTPAANEPTTEHAAAKAAPHSDGAEAVSADGHRSTTPIAARPEGLLKKGAEQKIRDKLSEDGLLEDGKTSTETALRRFQGSHDLPTTGIPDHETIKKLGLAPDDVFRKAPTPSR